MSCIFVDVPCHMTVVLIFVVVVSCCRPKNNANLLCCTLAMAIMFNVLVVVVLVSHFLYKVGCEILVHENHHADFFLKSAWRMG